MYNTPALKASVVYSSTANRFSPSPAAPYKTPEFRRPLPPLSPFLRLPHAPFSSDAGDKFTDDSMKACIIGNWDMETKNIIKRQSYDFVIVDSPTPSFPPGPDNSLSFPPASSPPCLRVIRKCAAALSGKASVVRCEKKSARYFPHSFFFVGGSRRRLARGIGLRILFFFPLLLVLFFFPLLSRRAFFLLRKQEEVFSLMRLLRRGITTARGYTTGWQKRGK